MEPQSQQSNDETIWSNLQKFAGRGKFSQIIVGLAILMIVAQFTGLNPGTMFDRWFGLKEQQQQQSYDLQVKTVDLIENKVMTKLDDIYKRLDNVDSRLNLLETRVTAIELENKEYHKK